MLRIDPETLLDSVGIDNYRVDHEASAVYLPEKEYNKLAEYLSKSQMSCEMEYGGWRWCKDAETANTR